ncbi:MAG: hypothetical protein NVSMB9_04900 [Isosphaeraceae bacterium]
MNPSDLLDYSLGQLEGENCARIERELPDDPEAAEIVVRLRRVIHQLLNDGDTILTPPGLASRTVAYVNDTSRRKRSILDFVPVSVPFRPADIAVAASIFLAGLLTLLPAVERSRGRVDQAGCGYNLQQLGRALWQYGSRHAHYPNGLPEQRNSPAGAYAAMLSDSGLLSRDDMVSLLDCPGNGRLGKARMLPACDSLCDLVATDLPRFRELITSDYAYNVGHYNRSGKVVPVTSDSQANIFLLGDQPPHIDFRQVLPGNSPNHGGRGQNVLYADLHVGWHNTRRVGPQDDDMFTNALHQLAPGLNPKDVSLMPSLASFLNH